MMEANAHVPEPEITFADGTPSSATFGDVYFSRAGGAAETEHVFLAGNGLPERWCYQPHFTIGELGFGTGLNFLVTWKRFVETADAGAQLHYLAIEQFPWTRDALAPVLASQPELAEFAEQLLAALPLRLPGLRRIHLPRVTLTLFYGEAEAMLQSLDVPVDAWFLDGFSPAKNAAMWREEVLAHVGRFTAPGGSFATFTAAGFVKRELEAQGFVVSKRPGFGHKREMLVGSRPSLNSESRILSSPSTAIVIGAGIAGATLAHALATRGVAVSVLEAGEVASGASGNAAAVLFPQLTKRWTPAAAWYFAGYDFMLRQLPRLPEATYAQPGMLRLPRHAEEEAQLRALNATLVLDASIVRWVERAEAEEKAGVPLATGAAFFTHGTWIDPAAICQKLLQHENITLHTQIAANSLRRDGQNWVVETADGLQHRAQHVCVAASYETAALLGDYGLKLNRVAGQVSEFAAADTRSPLRSILCHKGYVIPRGERILIGATYNHDVSELAATDANHAENLEQVESFLPGWLPGEAMGGRMAFRATTPDRLPYVGALAEGLYASSGHGSRGMLSAPFAAEVIASMITGEQVPLTETLRKAVNPLRFKK